MTESKLYKRKIYTLSDFRSRLVKTGLLSGEDLTDPDTAVRVLSFDSRAVGDGTLFIAKGAAFRQEYLADAYSSGAFAYVSEKRIGDFPNMLLVSDIREAMTVLAEMFWCDPLSSLRSLAVTGTKGKTTTVSFLKRILDLDAEKRGVPAAGISSSTEVYDGEEEPEPVNTTPEAPMLWSYFAKAAASGIDSFVVEVSSQALKYRRVGRMNFTVGCITNIGKDHIGPGEHTDFEDYFSSKLKLFDQCSTACVNIDDPLSDSMLDYARGRVPVITFGADESAEVRLSDVEKTGTGFRFRITVPEKSLLMSISMHGVFNVANALSAAAVSYAAGIPLETVAEALEGASVSGRMIPFASKDGRVSVIVDYAHNEMSFSALIDSIEAERPGAGIVAILGFTGGKGVNRRKDNGTLLGKRADFTIVTEKDSAGEPFEKIANEAAYWIDRAGGRYAVIKDREAALRLAFGIDLQKREKVIVFAGRGLEDMQKYGDRLYYYPQDTSIAEKVMAEYDSLHPAD